MPRAKIPRDQPRVIRHGDPLPDEEKQKLLDLLSYRDTPEKSALVIWDIEAALFLFVKGVAQIGNPPRPADYVREFKSIERKARALSEELFEINYHYSDELLSQGADCYTIAAELNKLAEVSRKARGQFAGQPSKGARKNTARLETIRRLRAAFASHFRGDASLTSRQKRLKEIAFVKAALKAAKIPCRDFGRLMRDHRTTPS